MKKNAILYFVIGDNSKHIKHVTSQIDNKDEYAIVYYPEHEKSVIEQCAWLNSIIRTNEKTIIVTDSPYIIFQLSNCVKAHALVQKGLDEVKLRGFMPQIAQINPDDYEIVEVTQYNAKTLAKYHGMPTDENYLNNMLQHFNDRFADLLELEDGLNKK